VLGSVAVDLRRPRFAVLATALAAATATALVAVLAGGSFASFKPSLHVAIETTAALAGMLAAYLVFFRFRRSARLDDLLLACGLAILSVCNLVYGAAPAALDRYPSRFETWALASGHLLAISVLALAAFGPTRRLARPRRVAWFVLGVSVLVLGVLAEALTLLARDLPIDVGTSAGHDAALGIQLASTVLFAAVAVGFVLRSERDGDELMTWFAIAATLRTFGGVNYALHPSLETGWVYSGDAFRMLFYVALLAGAAREIGRYWQASRDAAVLDERRRIARNLHDGLAQELAFIAGRVARERGSTLAAQIARAVERALDESRRVIAALTRPLDEPLDVVLTQEIEDVAERSGTILALALERGVRVEPDVREALVRIAREAVVNAVRHGGAGLVQVELENGNGLLLRVVDDGRGFDTDPEAGKSAAGGFGLISMRERAHAIGADLRVDSRPGDGTTVEVELL
jgi:signal transduction histidine kinase